VTLLRGIGRSVDVHEMNEGAVLRSLEWMRAQRNAQEK
jgi:hypothetical protein